MHAHAIDVMGKLPDATVESGKIAVGRAIDRRPHRLAMETLATGETVGSQKSEEKKEEGGRGKGEGERRKALVQTGARATTSALLGSS